MFDFLHGESSVRSRNRMRQSQAKAVLSKSAFTNIMKLFDNIN